MILRPKPFQKLSSVIIAGFALATFAYGTGPDSHNDTKPSVGVGQEAVRASHKLVTPLEFRNMFLSFLDEHPTEHRPFTQAEKNLLMFMPTKELLDSPKWKSGQTEMDFLKELRAKYSKVSPMDLHQEGVRTPANPASRDQLEADLIKHPLTMVIVPGIFGEFIANRGFQEFFTKNGKYDAKNKLWTAEVKNAAGKTLFKLVLFETPKMDFESLGKIKDIGKLFSNRLEAYTKEHKPENIALIGYSRGTITGLEMVAKASAAEHQPEWFKKTRAMISLGGVTLGSDLADVATTKGTPTQKQLAAFEAWADALQPVLPRKDYLPINTSNYGTNLKNEFLNLGIAKENAAIDTKNAQIFSANEIARKVFEVALLSSGAELGPFLQMARQAGNTDVNGLTGVGQEMLDAFGINKALFSDYNKNIAQFKRFKDSLMDGTGELATKKRLDWFKQNELPSSIKYYAVGGVMEHADSPLVRNNRVAYNPGSLDDANQDNSYGDFVKASGTKLNDGQMALDRIGFPNELLTHLNPEQKKLDSGLLGIIGGSHWTEALQIVFPTKPASRNPFPREALMKAVAASVVQGLK